ncbi:MAG: tetratricopeptide repeat protein [Deltaproteobacteria bacterium]|nr:tetratricopeptide repeat protein [Deltaproteobacteria bacterium]
MQSVHLAWLRAACAVSLLLLAGCALIEPDESEEDSSSRQTIERTTVPEDQVPPSGPAGDLEESAIESPTPTASPTPTVAQAPEAAAPAAIPATAVDGTSVLNLINTSTPSNVAAALHLVEEGRLQLMQQQFDVAREGFEHSLSIDPTSPYGYYFLAQLHYQRQSYDQAMAFAGRAAGLARQASSVWQGRIAALQGSIYEAVGRYPDARQAYKQAVRADPDNATARAGLARVDAP